LIDLRLLEDKAVNSTIL